MSSAKKIGLFACTGVVAGNMMGSGIALLPANLASIGGIAIWGWVISIIGAMSLAYVYARLATKNPQQGGPIAYAGEISPAFGFQTGVLYYHANWIGNLAIGITAVSYLSTFFPILNNPVPAGIACIAIVWIFTFVNMLGGTWVSRLTTIGLVLVLIPVVMTAVVGWHWFDVATYQANWNTSSTTDSHAVIKSILLCLWAFVGVESAAVSTGMVKNPNVPCRWLPCWAQRWPVSSISPRLRLSPVCILLLRWPRPVRRSQLAPLPSSAAGLHRWYPLSPPLPA